MTTQEILNLFPFYDKLSQSVQNELLRNAATVTIPSGTFYFEEGQSCANLALVGSGDIRVFKRGETGREITLYHVIRSETCILTASCVLGQSSYPASAVVDRDAQAIVFPAVLFRDLVSRSEIIRQFVFETIAERMEGVLSLIAEITFRKMDDRLCEFLNERLRQLPGTNLLQMTHEEIAIELGTAREVISRLLKDFERKGHIQQSRGQLLIHKQFRV